MYKKRDKQSKLKLINLGVPQGSILWTLRLLIYTNDLSVSQKKSNVILCQWIFVKSTSSASKIDEDQDKTLDNVNAWLIKNKLTLNTEKNKQHVFCNKNKKS